LFLLFGGLFVKTAPLTRRQSTETKAVLKPRTPKEETAVNEQAPARLDSISTSLSVIADPERVVLRYGPAVRSYIQALVRDEHDADDVAQELFLRVLRRGLSWAGGGRGRFRDYLKAVARHVAIDLVRARAGRARQGLDLDAVAAAERCWVDDWRACVLEATWVALEAHQHQRPGNFGHQCLRLALDHPEEDAAALADRLGQQVGRSLRPDAFRKQLSRARRLFARLLVAEVRRTLEQPSRARLEEELADLGLLDFLRSFLGPGVTHSDP
jgi:DNA-directed RNA polymerase specialized sigma24 family protein